jgi:hypothetical protein
MTKTSFYLVFTVALSASMIGFVTSVTPQLVITAIVALTMLAILLRKPELILGVFLSAMFVWTFLPGSLYERLTGLFLPLTAGLAGGALIVRYKIRPERVDALGMVLLAFSFYLYVAVFWSPALTYGFFKATSFFIGSTLLYFVVLWVYRQRPEDAWHLVTVVTLLGLLAVVITFVASLNTGFAVDARTSRVYYIRYVMGFEYYALSNSLQLSAICAFALYQRKRESTERWLWLVVFTFAFWGLLALSQRAQILGVIAACMILVATSSFRLQERLVGRSRVTPRFLLGGAMILALLVISVQSASKLNLAFLAEDGNISARLDLYQSARMIFWDSPLWGTGTGSFSSIAFGVDERIFAHNVILDTFVEGGFIGFILLFGVLYTVFLYARRLPRERSSISMLGWIGLSIFVSRLLVGMLSADLASLNLGPWLAMLAIGVSDSKRVVSLRHRSQSVVTPQI